MRVTAVDGATSYRWRYSTNATVTNSDPMLTSIGTEITITGLESNTSYWIDVRAENSAGESDYSDANVTSTIIGVPATPPTPTVVERTDIAIRVQVPVVGVVERYRWRISTNSTITDSDPAEESFGIDLNFITFVNLEPGTSYWIDVRAQNSIGNSAYSADLATSTTGTSTVTPGVPATPTLVSRTDTTITVQVAPVSLAIGYRWRISPDSTIDSLDTEKFTVANSVTFSGLDPDTNYWIDVASRSNDADSDYSADLATSTTLPVTEWSADLPAPPFINHAQGIALGWLTFTAPYFGTVPPEFFTDGTSRSLWQVLLESDTTGNRIYIGVSPIDGDQGLYDPDWLENVDAVYLSFTTDTGTLFNYQFAGPEHPTSQNPSYLEDYVVWTGTDFIGDFINTWRSQTSSPTVTVTLDRG